MDNLKDRILDIVKNALKGRISESLLLETFEMDEELEPVPIEQIKIAVAELLNDCEIEEVGSLIPTDSPTAWIMKTIYAMPDSFYRPEIKWEIGACLSFICPWEEIEKRFCSGRWQEPVTFATRYDSPVWVDCPIHYMKRNGKWKVKREMRTTSQMDGWVYFLVDKDGEVYKLREVNDQY
jgi:hypothetical protein